MAASKLHHLQTKNPVQALVESEQATTPPSNALNQLTSGAQVYTQLQLESMIDRDISCFSFVLFVSQC